MDGSLTPIPKHKINYDSAIEFANFHSRHLKYKTK